VVRKYALKPLLPLLLLVLGFRVFIWGIAPIYGTMTQSEYESIVSSPFFLGNDTQQTKFLLPGEAVVDNEALIEIYCHLYANSTGNITLLIDPDFWNETLIPVAIGQTINVTVTNGNLNLDSDVAAILQVSIQRKSTTDVVQGLVILKVITSGWRKVPWDSFVSFGLLLFLALMKKSKRNS